MTFDFFFQFVLFAIFALAAARPAYDDDDSVEITKDEREYPSAAGQYSLDFETSDGTSIRESGYGSGPDGAVETQGSVTFELPNGETFELTYVADAEGAYQPESSYLPVAPAFPHPIPQFVLDQIEKAAREDAEADSDEERYSYE